MTEVVDEDEDELVVVLLVDRPAEPEASLDDVELVPDCWDPDDPDPDEPDPDEPDPEDPDDPAPAEVDPEAASESPPAEPL